MTTVNSYGDGRSNTLLEMLYGNRQGKNSGKKTAAKPSLLNNSGYGDTVSITSRVASITASLSLNVATTVGRVDIIGCSSINANTRMMRLPEYVAPQAQHSYFKDGLTKADPPAMSDGEFEQAIIELAQKHAAAGMKSGHLEDDYIELSHAYITVASPDRKGLIANAAKTATIPVDLVYNSAEVYDENGVRCAIYCHSNGWMALGTPAEQERIRQFQDIYRAAMKEAWEQPSTTE